MNIERYTSNGNVIGSIQNNSDDELNLNIKTFDD